MEVNQQPYESNPVPPPNPPEEAEASFGNDEVFTPLEGESTEPPFESLPSEPPIEPFTGEEIVNGTAMALALGLRFQTPEEAQAFVTAYKVGVLPCCRRPRCSMPSR